MFRCYSYTIIRERFNSYLLKLLLLKYSIEIYRCVVNTVVCGCIYMQPHHHCINHTRINALPDDGATVTSKHIGVVLM